jgi:hypothetical protein
LRIIYYFIFKRIYFYLNKKKFHFLFYIFLFFFLNLNKFISNKVNEIIILMNRRKALIKNKRKKLKIEFLRKTDESKRISVEEQ